MRVCCLVNLHSGGHLGLSWRKALSSIQETFEGELEIESIGERPLAEIFSKGYSSYDLIVICGGDGTFSSVLPHFVGSDVPLALVPLGTGNDLARELCIPKVKKEDFLDWVVKFQSYPHVDLSVWEADLGGRKRFFVNYFSAGFDGDVIRFFDTNRRRLRWLSQWFGLLGNRALYLLGCLWHLAGAPLKEVRVTSNGVSIQVTKARTLFFSNIQSVMGFATSHPKSSAFDEKLELTSFPSWRNYLGLVIPFCPWKPVHYTGARDWIVEGLPEGCFLQADGESLSLIGEERGFAIRYAGTVKISGVSSKEVVRDL